ncbi:MAG: PD40 domain-containing protein [Anaerolineales bacterium]|nr:PD40 domain-containing protein [Anaerolineales bacterium]
MENKYIYESVLILLIVGCSSAQPTSFPPTFISGGESTLPAFTETPEIQVSQTSAPLIEVEVNLPVCFDETRGEISLASITKGSLVNRGSYSPILLEIQSNKAYKIPLTSENSYTSPDESVSPNRDLLATIEIAGNELWQFERAYLHIFNARGEMVERIVFEIPGLHKIRWLDNENILLYIANTSRDGTVLLINPFTKKQNYITNVLPDFFDESDIFFPGLKSLIEYSPNLEWGVYLKRDTSGAIATPFPGGPNIGHAVYDFSADKTIWIPKHPTDFSEEPKWSPDGNKVVIEANNQFTIVTREGILQPILDETETNYIQFPEWSPDGHYIAFWNGIKFMIYDTQENTLHNLCINTHADFRTPIFVWSPDNHYIFIGADSETNSILIDIEEDKIYNVSTNPIFYYPVGWMNSVP